MSTLQVNSIVNLNNEAQFGPVLANTLPNTLSGTTSDVLGIPSWVKKITVLIAGLSTNGSSNYLLQLGTSGGFTTTGYLAASTALYNTASVSGVGYTTGFGVASASNVNVLHGAFTLSLMGTSNLWVCTGIFGYSTPNMNACGGSVTLADVLTKIRLTTVNGTDTFDAGSMNVMWE